jgi:hypothetical protein
MIEQVHTNNDDDDDDDDKTIIIKIKKWWKWEEMFTNRKRSKQNDCVLNIHTWLNVNPFHKADKHNLLLYSQLSVKG